MNNPNWPWQGGDPSSSSSQRYMPLALLTSYPAFQSSFNVANPNGGNIPGNNLAPLAAPMPGPGNHYLEVAGPSVPNTITNQNPAVFIYQPGSATVFNAPGYNNPHASVYQPGAPLYAQPGAAANNDPHTSAGMVALPAYANQGASRGAVAGGGNRSRRALQAFLAKELLDDVERAHTRRDLEAIVHRVIRHHYNGDRVLLMEVAEPSDGERALKELVRLVAQNLAPEALQRLFRCLIHGWIMEQSNGPHLLQHFFTKLNYVDCSIFIDEFAVPRFWEMVTSGLGHGRNSLMTCLDNTGYYAGQGTVLHDTLEYLTVEIARNINGFPFLRKFFERGRNDRLKERIRERVVGNLVELSMCRYGNNVVQACFIPRNRRPYFSETLLRRWLQAFLRLRDEELRRLLQNHSARYVLRRLIRTSRDLNAAAAAEATDLAEVILVLGQGYWRRGDVRAQAIAFLEE